MARPTATGSLSISTKTTDIKGNGSPIYPMVKETSSSPVANMMVASNWAWKRGKVFTNKVPSLSTKGSSATTNHKIEAKSPLQMGIVMKVCGRTAPWRDMEFIVGVMEIFTKESSTMDSNMEKEPILKFKVPHMRDFGKMEKGMVKEFLEFQVFKILLNGSGRMIFLLK